MPRKASNVPNISASIRFPKPEMDAVTEWRREQLELLPVATAIRILVARALTAHKERTRQPSPPNNCVRRNQHQRHRVACR
jgi:hypothetical protein